MAPSVTPNDRLTLDKQVCFNLAVAARDVIALYRPLLEPLGLTHPQYLVLLALWQHPGPVPLCVKDLRGLLKSRTPDAVPGAETARGGRPGHPPPRSHRPALRADPSYPARSSPP